MHWVFINWFFGVVVKVSNRYAWNRGRLHWD